jgi:hypothetical protein
MKTQDRILLTISMIFGSLAIIGGIVTLVYWLLGHLDSNGLRWYAVIVTLAVPVVTFVTYRLATHAAREHLAGFDRGLTGAQKTVETMGRSLAATASIAKTSARPTMTARTIERNHSDLLPQVGSMKLIESRRDVGEVIDL